MMSKGGGEAINAGVQTHTLHSNRQQAIANEGEEQTLHIHDKIVLQRQGKGGVHVYIVIYYRIEAEKSLMGGGGEGWLI